LRFSQAHLIILDEVRGIKVEKNKAHVTYCGAGSLRAASTIVSTLGWRPQECGRGKHECLRHTATAL